MDSIYLALIRFWNGECGRELAAGGPEQILYNCKMCGTSYCSHNNLRLYPYVLWCPVMARG